MGRRICGERFSIGVIQKDLLYGRALRADDRDREVGLGIAEFSALASGLEGRQAVAGEAALVRAAAKGGKHVGHGVVVLRRWRLPPSVEARVSRRGHYRCSDRQVQQTHAPQARGPSERGA